MPRHHISLMALAPLCVLFAVPGAAQANVQRGTILQVDRAHGILRTVDADRRTRSWIVRQRLSRRLRTGVRVRFRAERNRAWDVQRTGFAPQLVANGRIRNARTVELADGRQLPLAGHHRLVLVRGGSRSGTSSGPSLTRLRLRPGQAVRVTIFRARKSGWRVTIERLHPLRGAGARWAPDEWEDDRDRKDEKSPNQRPDRGDSRDANSDGEGAGDCEPVDECEEDARDDEEQDEEQDDDWEDDDWEDDDWDEDE